MNTPKQKKRGRSLGNDAILVTVWMDRKLVNALDQGVDLKDTDRSKLIREALREKLSRLAG